MAESLSFLNFYLVSFMALFLMAAGCCKQEHIPKYIKDLKSSNANARNEAALGLAKCGSPEADGAVADLIRLLRDPNVGVQSSAAYALRRIATPEAKRALERASNKGKFPK